MKKILLLILAAVLILSVCSCGNCESNDNSGDMSGKPAPYGSDQLSESYVLKGKVVAVSDRIEIEVVDSDIAFGVYWVLVSDDTELVNELGKIFLSDISVGDMVEVVYGGQVMMSYPPQIAARKVTLL